MKRNGQALLRVENLKKYFPVRRGVFSRVTGYVRAVDDISFEVRARETLSLVGESGSGKTTTGRTILRLMEPTEGKVCFDDIDVLALQGKELRALRRRMQIIFQDPYGSLNPRMTVGAMIGEPLAIHKLVPKKRRRDRVVEILELVGLEAEHMSRYPHEFSGGQRQRIGIARALAVQPELIVADEPVASLDVSIQAQILNLLEDLQQKLGLTYLFIAHDLSVVRHISNEVAVMYLGKIVERAHVDELFANPLHPYTVALLSAVPIPDPTAKSEHVPLEGDIPSPINPPSGCRFHTRCPKVMPRCSEIEPVLEEKGGTHFAACHLYNH
jgi:oligopeptide/dipeptide ABC transporter ATP-binding protein